MIPFAAASFGLGLASAGASWWLGEKQAKQQRADTAEQLRRLRLQHAATLGEATARGAASGFEFESQGLQTFLTAMSTEFTREEKWMKAAGDRQADATSLAAKLGFLGGATGSFNNFAAANNWWQAAPGAATASGAGLFPSSGVALSTGARRVGSEQSTLLTYFKNREAWWSGYVNRMPGFTVENMP